MHPLLPDADPQTLATNSRLVWAIVAAMLAALCVGYWAAGLSLDLWSGRSMLSLLPACIIVSWFYRTRRPDPWISYGAESVAQVAAILIAGTLITYAAAASGFPYRDGELQTIDRALGLDWRGYLDFVNLHPRLGFVCHAVYFSMKPQTVLVIGALIVTSHFQRLQQFALALAATLIITIALFIFRPAVGAFAHLGLGAADTPHFVPSMTYQQMAQLDGIRSGTLHIIHFDALEGLIAFPSFHCAAGILAAWALWPCRQIRWWVLALNAAMVASAPVEGAHYFIDLPAGAAVAAAGVWISARMLALMLRLRADAPRVGPAREGVQVNVENSEFSYSKH